MYMYCQVLAIYQAGIDKGDATFETAAPTGETFDAEKLPEHRLVALDEGGGRVLGWVAVARTSNRPGYANVVEHSAAARVDPGWHGGGRTTSRERPLTTPPGSRPMPQPRGRGGRRSRFVIAPACA